MCNHEAGSVEQAAQRWQGKVDVIGVAWNGDAASFNDFISRHSLTFPQISDPQGDVFAHFDIPGQPAWVIVDAAGKATRVLGALEPADLDAAFNAALAA